MEKVTASARARILTREVHKVVNTDLNESYVSGPTVSNDLAINESTVTAGNPSLSSGLSDSILVILQKLQNLTKCY